MPLAQLDQPEPQEQPEHREPQVLLVRLVPLAQLEPQELLVQQE